MWSLDWSILETVFRTAIVYVVVLVGLRLTGKREVGQMTPFDLVLLLLIANAVQNAMTGPDTSLTGGIVAVLTLLGINALMSRVAWRHPEVRKIVAGTPTLLIYNGKMLAPHLEHEHITSDELLQALREHGVASVSQVYTATLEIDGSISVLKNDERPTASLPHHHIRFIARKNT